MRTGLEDLKQAQAASQPQSDNLTEYCGTPLTDFELVTPDDIRKVRLSLSLQLNRVF